MNPLFESPPNHILVDGHKVHINTSFTAWISHIVACKRGNAEDIERTAKALFVDDVSDDVVISSVQALANWAIGDKKQPKKDDEPSEVYCFEFDGEAIWAGLWEYFPEKMKQGVAFHEGLALVSAISQKDTAHCEFARRVFSRVCKLSEMSKEQREYWQKVRDEYAIPTEKKEKQEESAIAAILRGDGDLTKLRSIT